MLNKLIQMDNWKGVEKSVGPLKTITLIGIGVGALILGISIREYGDIKNLEGAVLFWDAIRDDLENEPLDRKRGED